MINTVAAVIPPTTVVPIERREFAPAPKAIAKGTEPKIKYYLFGSGEASPTNLQDSKDSINNMLTTVGDWLVENAHERVK